MCLDVAVLYIGSISLVDVREAGHVFHCKSQLIQYFGVGHWAP